VSGHEGERLCAYHDRELPPGERAAVAAHLAACPECTALLADMAAVDATAASLPAGAPEGYFDSLPSRVVARLGAASKAPTRMRRLPVWTWAAAAALLIGVVAPLTLRQSAPGSVAAVPSPGAPEPALGNRGQELGRDALAAPDAPPPPAARRGPAFAAPGAPVAPTAAGSGLAAAEKRGEKEGESEAVREPLPAPAVSADRAVSPLARAEAPAQRVAGEEPPLLRTEALATDDAVRASAHRAPAASSASMETSPLREKVRGGALSASEAGAAFGRIENSQPRTAAGWRSLCSAWSAFAAAYSEDPRADEARVRAIEARREAWLAGGDDDDAAAFRREARAYLDRADARQKERVERLLPSRQP
jgi:anti-sigma factor RsiW